MAVCDPDAVMAQGGNCWLCLSQAERESAIVQLLCDIANETPPVTTTIYWGNANSVDFPYGTFQSWDDSQVQNLLDSLSSAVQTEFDAAGYQFSTSDPSTAAWFVVPDSFDTPLPGLGFKYALGTGSTPTEIARSNHFNPPYLVPTPEEAILWNGSTGTSESNGWVYSYRVVGGVAYRFYVFVQWRQDYDASFGTLWPNPWNGMQRTSNVETWFDENSIGAANLPVWIHAEFPDNPGSSFNCRSVYCLAQTFVGGGTFLIYRRGADETLGPSINVTLSQTFCDAFILDGGIGNLNFKLFVETAAVPQTANTVYWGMMSSTTYNPIDFDSWSQAKFDAFIAAFPNSENGPYRSNTASPYTFTAGSSNMIAWIAAPYTYNEPFASGDFLASIASGPWGPIFDPDASTINVELNNIVVANGFVVLPFEQVRRGQYSYRLDQSPDPYSFAGWTWFVRNINGQPYRFFPFIIVWSNNPGIDPMYEAFWNDGNSPSTVAMTVTV